MFELRELGRSEFGEEAVGKGCEGGGSGDVLGREGGPFVGDVLYEIVSCAKERGEERGRKIHRLAVEDH